jgi:hypothetical protein
LRLLYSFLRTRTPPVRDAITNESEKVIVELLLGLGHHAGLRREDMQTLEVSLEVAHGFTLYPSLGVFTKVTFGHLRVPLRPCVREFTLAKE